MRDAARSGPAALALRLLLAASLAMPALSASTAASLGMGDLRIVVFAALFALLALGGFLARPVLERRQRTAPLVALWLLLLLAAVHQGKGELLDYKVVLPILALLIAPNLRAALGRLDLARLILWLGGLYVAATAAAGLLLPSVPALRDAARHVRVDLTGSVVLHASLCTILAVAAVAALPGARHGRHRLVLGLVAATAAGMVLLTGTRTALLTLLLTGLFAWAAIGFRSSIGSRGLGLALALVLALAGLSFVVGDTLWSWLFELDQADYSSGRWPSIRHWLMLGGGAPFGLGPGAVRGLLAEGRPPLGAEGLLEWPHNELVRFYVEGGVPGLVLVLLIAGEVTRLALRHAARSADPAAGALALVIAADLWAQCLFQNYFNAVYHATMMCLVVGLLAAGRESGEPDP